MGRGGMTGAYTFFELSSEKSVEDICGIVEGGNSSVSTVRSLAVSVIYMFWQR
jgi:hypothetical protein